MQPMVGGKLSKSEESYPNARKTRALESVQFKENMCNMHKIQAACLVRKLKETLGKVMKSKKKS